VIGRLPLNLFGRHRFQEVLFPAKARIQMKLLVQIPGERLNTRYEVFVRQLFENEEVGRVTWRLGKRAEATAQ
jgi:serine protease